MKYQEILKINPLIKRSGYILQDIVDPKANGNISSWLRRTKAGTSEIVNL